MIFLKPANMKDYQKEYLAIINFPADDNGFINEYYDAAEQEFRDKILPTLINHSKGIELPDGYVPCTYYFLWNDNRIVGLFKVRHQLNDALKNSSGHIDYGILKEYRHRKYATRGLGLAVDELKKIITEDEIYLSCNRNNEIYLKVQENNGAYVHHYDDRTYYMRIRIHRH